MLYKKGISELLIDFIYHLKYSDLPSEVVHQAKKCFLDYLGVVLGGSTTETANKIKTFLSKFDDRGKITAIGYHRKTDILKASLANGITSHVLELDDGHRRGTVHAGAIVFSTLLPLIEQEGIDGRSAIASIVAGYETALMVGKAIQPSHRSRGFHATATCGTFGAAMAAAKALNLSETEMSNALGLAGTSASGLLQFLADGTEIKQYHPGKAAMCGVLSAYLAQSGITAPHNILEGERGFLHATTDGIDISAIIQDRNFSILDVYFKPYAACRHCHAPIEATLNIRSKNNLSADEVSRINILSYKSAVDGHDDSCPHSVVGAKMSVPFSVAVALKKGWAGPKEFDPASFDDPEIINLAKKVELKEDTELTDSVPEKRPAIVEIFTKDGNRYSERVDLPKGEPENPVTDEEMKKKFADLASCCRSHPEIASMIDIVEKTEEKIGELFQFLY